MDGLNTMTIQSILLEHIFIFKKHKHSIKMPPRVTVWSLSAVSFYLAQPPSVVSKCVLAGKQKASLYTREPLAVVVCLSDIVLQKLSFRTQSLNVGLFLFTVGT